VLAEGLAGLGRLDEALSTVDAALTRARRGGELVYAPEILRTQGELILKDAAPGSAAAAERCFLEAIDLASQQDALLWKLRATLSLARLMVKDGRGEQARSELSLIYDQFTEGFESGDLRAARSLLGERLADKQSVAALPSSERRRPRG
jgi:predicted ATPase